MSYTIFTTSDFDKEVKRLSKKYKSLKQDLMNFSVSLSENPFQGVVLSGNVRKIRMSISSKGKGKSGGARVITFNVAVSEETGDVYLVTIYDKSERSSISDKEIDELLVQNGLKK